MADSTRRRRRVVPNFLTSHHSITDTEEIIRKSYKETLKDYMKNSSIAGFKNMVEPGRSRAERFMWLLVITISILSIGYITTLIWGEFNEKPTIEYIESNQYPVWKVPFPSVAICNNNKISKKRAKEYARYLINQMEEYEGMREDYVEEAIEEVFSVLIYLGRNVDHDIEGQEYYLNLMNFLQNVDKNKTESGLYDIVGIMKMLAPSCEEMLIRCSWKTVVDDCMNYFSMRKTGEGFCCTFNYYEGIDNSDYDRTLNKEYAKLAASTQYTGLSVVINPQLNDYYYTMHSSMGINVLLFPPYNYPDVQTGGVTAKFVPANVESFLDVRPRTVQGTEAIESLKKMFTFEKRGCMFHDDLPEVYNNLYSYSNCLILCKMRTMKTLCKCVPYFMPEVFNDTFYCDLEHIPCLNNYRNKFRSALGGDFDYYDMLNSEGFEGFEEAEDGLYCDMCFPDCSYTKYRVENFLTSLKNVNKLSKLFQGLNLNNHSVIHIYYGDLDSEIYKMDARFYWFEILSNIGGIFGFFLGFSVISIVEFIYFFTVVYFQNLRKNGYKICGKW